LSKEQLQRTCVSDWINLVEDANKILSKYNMREKIITKAKEMAKDITAFRRNFQDVYNQRLTCLWSGNLDLFTEDQYNEMLLAGRKEDSKFESMEHRLNGKTIKGLLSREFYLLADINQIFEELQCLCMEIIPNFPY